MRAAAIWVAIIGVLLVVLRLFASRMIYYPMRYPAGEWGVQRELGAKDVWLTARDGVRVHGWWLAVGESRVTTLFLHGNAGNVTHRARHAAEIAGAGSSLLVIDYRGYGKSEGSPSEQGLYADADAAYEWLGARGHAPEGIIVHGESLGTAVAVDLAVRRACAGVILEAPLESVGKMAGTVLPVVGPVLAGGFDTLGKIGRLRVPVLIIHGDRDEVVPQWQGRGVYQAAREPKWFWSVTGAGHNDLVYAAGGEYRERLKEFYSRCRR